MSTVDLFPSLLRMLAASAVVIALLVATLWLLKRGAGGRRGARGFAVEAALPLGERRSLAIVTVVGMALTLCILGWGRPAYRATVTALATDSAERVA